MITPAIAGANVWDTWPAAAATTVIVRHHAVHHRRRNGNHHLGATQPKRDLSAKVLPDYCPRIERGRECQCDKCCCKAISNSDCRENSMLRTSLSRRLPLGRLLKLLRTAPCFGMAAVSGVGSLK